MRAGGVLLPLDGGGRLAGHVEHHPVDLGDLVGDPGRDRGQHRVRAAGPSRRSSRPRWSPGGARPGSRSCGRRPGRRPSGRRRAARPGTARSARSRPAADSSARTIASAARTIRSRSAVTSPTILMARPGPGNGCRHTICGGSPSSAADLAHLVLEQRPQRLDQLERQVVGQPADVVVRLDVGGRRCRRRTRPRPGRACPGPGRSLSCPACRRAGPARPRSVICAGGLLERADELPADDLALLLRVGDPGQRGQELARRRPPRAGPPRWRRRSPARPARPRRCAAARDRRTRRSAGSRWPAGRGRRPPRSPRRRTARRSRGRRRPARRSARPAPR